MVALNSLAVGVIATLAISVEAGKVGKAIKGVVGKVLKVRDEAEIWERGWSIPRRKKT